VSNLDEVAPEVEASERSDDKKSTTAPVEHDRESGVFCNECGWKNPPGARFCSKCGHALQVVGADAGETPVAASPSPEVSAPKRSNPSGTGTRKARRPEVQTSSKETPAKQSSAPSGGLEPGAGKRMGILVGASVLVVLALFMVFNLNKGDTSVAPTTTTSIQAPAEPPLEGEFAQRESALQSELAGLTGEARIDKQREILTLYFTSGRFDLAAAQAEVIGEATGAESAWIDAGNFYYDWMESSPAENKAYYSRKATSAYQRALEINPDNLDTRTDMAVAYLYDPDNSMLAIQETQKVLEADSNHVQANFNRGIMLWQINRMDEAVAQFEKVLRLVDDPTEPIYQRASEALTSLRQGGVGS